MEAKAKKVHSGQYRPYGDSETVWDVEMEGEFREVLAWCKENLMGGNDLPLESNFFNLWRDGDMTMGDYFKGYYRLAKIPGDANKWRFTHVAPFTD